MNEQSGKIRRTVRQGCRKAGVLVWLLVFVMPSLWAESPKWDWKPKYMGEIHTGYGTTTSVKGHDTYMGRVMLGMTHGVAFGKFGDVGVGIDGVMYTHYYKGESMTFAANPYVSVRPAYPITKSFSVFLDCSLGASILCNNNENTTNEFLFQFGPGIKFKRLSVCCGMQNIGSGEGSTSFFAKLGIYLGKQ